MSGNALYIRVFLDLFKMFAWNLQILLCSGCRLGNCENLLSGFLIYTTT